MPRRHRRRTSHKENMGLSRFIGHGAFGLAFLSQLMSKDITNNPSFANADLGTKAKFTVNEVVGRITGINPFSDTQQFSQTINPSGIFNKTTGIGLGLLIYDKIGGSFGLPKLASKKIANGVFKGGIVGGFFDAPKTEAFTGYTGSQVNKGTQSGMSGTGLSQ